MEASWMRTLWTTITDESIVDGCVVYGFIINDLFLWNLKLDHCLHRPCPHMRCQHLPLWTITLRMHLLNHAILCMIAVLIHNLYDNISLCNILTERILV